MAEYIHIISGLMHRPPTSIWLQQFLMLMFETFVAYNTNLLTVFFRWYHKKWESSHSLLYISSIWCENSVIQILQQLCLRTEEVHFYPNDLKYAENFKVGEPVHKRGHSLFYQSHCVIDIRLDARNPWNESKE